MSDLLRLAILGTAQAAGSADSGTDADALVAKLALPNGERERALLLRAGAAAVLRRAGTRAAALAELPAPAIPETLTRASASLAGLLAGLLEGDSHELLAEALEGMAERALRLPEELLPLALDEGDLDIRRRLLPVLGCRGQWLADQASQWSLAPEAEAAWAWAKTGAPHAGTGLAAPAEQLWEEGTDAEREQVLTVTRQLDPARALALLRSTFKNDKPEQRQRWIELLDVGLSMADAPFLDSVAHDRSAAVRLAAARTLWRLPESTIGRALRERMCDLCGAGASFAVTLPPEPFDPTLERLGILESPPAGVGRRQWWLAQLVSALPPDFFCENWALAPGVLIELASHHDLGQALLDGWTSAALRFDAQAWLAPLWDAWSLRDAPAGWIEPEPLLRLTEQLAPSRLTELEARLIRCVQQSRHAELLAALPRPWSPALGEAFMAAVEQGAAWFPSVWANAATAVPLALVPSTLEPASVGSGKKQPFDAALAKFLSITDLRRRVASEIAAHAAPGAPGSSQPSQET